MSAMPERATGVTRSKQCGSLAMKLDVLLRPDQIMRLYAGQADPTDDVRFTIRYEIDDRPGIIEGKLQANDTATLQIIDGPAATRGDSVSGH